MHKVLPQEVLGQALTKSPHDAKTVTALSGSWSSPSTIAAVVFDNILGKAEVHEHGYDAWHVISGEADFILGGMLHDQYANGDGEWLAESIDNAEVFKVKQGDIIDIPPGVPHQVDARGKRLETALVKNNLKGKI